MAAILKEIEADQKAEAEAREADRVQGVGSHVA
jgi:hypothetical protein